MRVDDRRDGDGTEPVREPAVRAPWPALALGIALIALYIIQALLAAPDAAAAVFGFAPVDLEEGRFGGLVTALFVHGGWAHVLLNALGALAFGAPVARFLGQGAVAALIFFGFFLLCGALASLGFAVLHPGAPVVLIGASGAVSGLMGAASRLIERRDALAPFVSRMVVGMAAGWLLTNLMLAVVGLDAVSGDAPIAWEAHLAGYAAGLLLIGPLAAITKRRRLTKL